MNTVKASMKRITHADIKIENLIQTYCIKIKTKKKKYIIMKEVSFQLIP